MTHIHTHTHTQSKQTQGETKMATLKSPYLPSSHGHIECTWGEIPSERNPETSWVTPTRQANEKIPMSKQSGQAKTCSFHKPHPWHSARQLGTTPQQPAAPWGVKGLDHIPRAPTFKTPTWGAGPKTRNSESQCGNTSIRPTGLAKKEAVLNGYVSTLHCWTPRAQCWGKRQNPPISHSFPGRGLTEYFTSYSLRAWLSCKQPGHQKRDCYKFKHFQHLCPLTSLSNVLWILNNGARGDYRGSSQSSHLIELEKHFSRLRMNLFQS